MKNVLLYRFAVLALSLTLILTLGFGTYANDSVAANAQTTDSARPQISEDQKRELEGMFDKWSGLTDKQKNEVYKLLDKQNDLKEKIIDKYAEFGVFDKTLAEEMKSRLNEMSEKLRANGQMPMFGFVRGSQKPSGKQFQ